MRRKERTKKEGKGGRKNSKKEWKTISMRMREMEKVEIYMANECVCVRARVGPDLRKKNERKIKARKNGRIKEKESQE